MVNLKIVFFAGLMVSSGLNLKGQDMNVFILSGSIIDSASRQPVEDASVALYKKSGGQLVTGNVTDVLKSQPSVTIDADEKIYLRGNANILILVDGRPSTLTSLNSIPASAIENIEIITNPDAKYDSEGTGGIINVITKRQSRNGLVGNLTLNYGLTSRVNGGVNISYSKKTWDIGLSYSGRLEKNTINSSLNRQLYSLTSEIQQDVHSNQKSYSNNAALTFSVRPTPKDFIVLGAKLTLPDVINNQQITGRQFVDTMTLSVFNRTNEVDWLRKSLEGTASYKRMFSKNKHELSFDFLFSR